MYAALRMVESLGGQFIVAVGRCDLRRFYRKAGLRFDVKEEAFKKLESGDYAIVPGKPAQSKMVKLITTSEG